MREGWEYKKLGEVCAEKKQIKRAAKCFSSSEQIQYIDISSIDNSIRKMTELSTMSMKEAPSRAQQKVEMNDILISTVRPNLKNIAIVDREDNNLVASSGFCVLRTSSVVEQRYVYYFVTSDLFTNHLVKLTTGANYPAVRDQDILESFIPLPPIPQQRLIVSELDEINSLIALKREQLKKYDELAQSLFYEMFGDPVENEKSWEVKELSANVEEMFLGPFGSALKVDSYVNKEEAFAMVYEQKHAIQGTLKLENHYIGKDKFDSLSRFEVKPGDFIMSCRGTIGKIFQLPDSAPKGIIHPSLMKIRVKSNVYSYTYFIYMLRKIVANETTNGNCVQMAITAKELGKKRLPLPPLSLQHLFAHRIEQIEEQKKHVTAAIAKLETLLASRMQYWFE